MIARTPLLLALASLLATTALAQNDECTTAAPLTLGSVPFDTTTATLSQPAWPCASSVAPDLWYVFTAPNSARYTFETCGSSYDTAIQVFSGTCAALVSLACNDDACGLSSRVRVDALAGETLFVRVGGWQTSSGLGTLTAIEVVPRQTSLVAHYKMDDVGGTCVDSSGNNLAGSYLGGTQGVAGAAPGTGTAVDFDGLSQYVEIPAQQPLDELLNDLSVACWFYLDGPSISNTNASRLHRLFGNNGPSGSWSFGVDDTNNQVVFTTHAVLDYVFNVPIQQNRWYHVAAVLDWDNDVTMYLDGVSLGTVAGTSPARTPNATYNIGVWWSTSATVPQFTNGKIDDVQVYGGELSASDIMGLFTNPGSTVGGTSIGTRYCSPAVANSTGASASLNVSGSAVISQNNMTLSTTQMPTNAFGYFLVSLTQGLVVMPGGSQGNLCLGGSIGRYVGPGQVLNSGPGGEISLPINLSQIPTPTGFVTAQPGQTWHFTAWFRDAIGGVATSNFADAVSVTFL